MTEENTYYLILGAGPAGLQLGYFLARADREYLILEKDDRVGAFFKKFPRHRKLISINKIYTGVDDAEINMRWDWNSLLSTEHEALFKEFSAEYFPPADALVSYLGAFARRYGLNVRTRTEATRIERTEGGYRVTTAEGGVIGCRVLLVATGMAKPYVPDIPGIEHAVNYADMDLDPKTFANKRVLIIGKGNSAFETADHIIGAAARIHVASPTPVKAAWDTHFVGDLRAVNNNFLDTYHLKSQNAALNARIQFIRACGDHFVARFHYLQPPDEVEDIEYDAVINCAGFQFDASIFDAGCRPELTVKRRFPALSPEWESVNNRGMFFLGAPMQSRDYRKTMSAFIHGFRYNVAALARILEERYHGGDLERQDYELDVETLLELLEHRINKTSATWQQPGFLGDFLVLEEDVASLYKELPFDLVKERMVAEEKRYYGLSLEYGAYRGPAGAAPRPRRDDVAAAAESNFLHPVIRYFHGAELLREHHVIEDLFAVWTKPREHLQPLRAFLEETLPVGGGPSRTGGGVCREGTKYQETNR